MKSNTEPLSEDAAQIEDYKPPSTMTKTALSSIIYPGQNDVMLGRGGESNYHGGNLHFRKFAEIYRARYKFASKVEKPLISAEVVAAWRNLQPPGRFLIRTEPSSTNSLWHDVGDAQAIKRATKTLGERPQRERRAEKASRLRQLMGSHPEERGCSSAPTSPQSRCLSSSKRVTRAIGYSASDTEEKCSEKPVAKVRGSWLMEMETVGSRETASESSDHTCAFGSHRQKMTEKALLVARFGATNHDTVMPTVPFGSSTFSQPSASQQSADATMMDEMASLPLAQSPLPGVVNQFVRAQSIRDIMDTTREEPRSDTEMHQGSSMVSMDVSRPFIQGNSISNENEVSPHQRSLVRVGPVVQAHVNESSPLRASGSFVDSAANRTVTRTSSEPWSLHSTWINSLEAYLPPCRQCKGVCQHVCASLPTAAFLAQWAFDEDVEDPDATTCNQKR
ncbi:expressed unknown protein [Seminavis robusta]|uniref:DUF6824 domain-containing protein n=1 Tax=Seminavis robusta TaxID=568900 RepID=A0A9N8HET3_9STRA|nr:expressed unknown protein [Seminavis robusta]|eukprot:Sro489_g153250.1 n/a (449) ;mRNA; f:20464-22111